MLAKLALVALLSAALSSAESACSGQQYNNIAGFPAKQSGCYPTNYYQTSDLGQTSPSDAQTRCEQQCSSMGASCGSVVAQVNNAADQPNFYPSGTCFFFAPGQTPKGPRQCANTAYLLIGRQKDDTNACFSRSKAAASSFCSSYIHIPLRTVTITLTPTVTTTQISTLSPSTLSTSVISATSTTSTTVTSVLSTTVATITSTSVSSTTTTLTQTSVTTAPVAKRKRAATVPAPACVTSGTPSTRLSAACSCLSIQASTTTVTATALSLTVTSSTTTSKSTQIFTTTQTVTSATSTQTATTIVTSLITLQLSTTSIQTVSTTTTTTATATPTGLSCAQIAAGMGYYVTANGAVLYANCDSPLYDGARYYATAQRVFFSGCLDLCGQDRNCLEVAYRQASDTCYFLGGPPGSTFTLFPAGQIYDLGEYS